MHLVRVISIIILLILITSPTVILEHPVVSIYQQRTVRQSASTVNSVNFNATVPPLLINLDKDAELETIIVSNNTVVAYDIVLNITFWTYQCGDNASFITSPLIADLDGDGELEIVLVDSLGSIYLLNKRGELVRKISSDNVLVAYDSIIFDRDLDGSLDVMLISSTGIAAYSIWGKSYKEEFNKDIVAQPMILDIYQNLTYYLIIPLADEVICNKIGEGIWRIPISEVRYLGVGNITGDNYYEIILVTANNTLYYIRPDIGINSTILPRITYSLSAPLLTTPVSADFDNDGLDEILLILEDSIVLIGVNSSGYLNVEKEFGMNSEPTSPPVIFHNEARNETLAIVTLMNGTVISLNATNITVIASNLTNPRWPLIADINNDNHADLLITVNNGTRMISNIATGKVFWSCYMHDSRRTNYYKTPNDMDSDGLPDEYELDKGLDATDSDTDNDFLNDYAEYYWGLNASLADSDKDGLSDSDELRIFYTDPLSNDTDKDGMPDGWEVIHDLNPLDPLDNATDPDDDGLTNLQEFKNGTNPRSPDTDKDGMPDGWEVAHELNPLKPDWFEDPDMDGLCNYDEYLYGTDPQNPDTDGDGLTDYGEIKIYRTDPLSKDSDSDGLTDLQEVLMGTNPLDPDTDNDSILDSEDKYPKDPTNGLLWLITTIALLIVTIISFGIIIYWWRKKPKIS